MQPTPDSADRYAVSYSAGGIAIDSGEGFSTIAEALDHVQDVALKTGFEAIITDHEGNRPPLAVRIANWHPVMSVNIPDSVETVASLL